MNKTANKSRDIKFFSPKNGKTITVHTAVAKRFCDTLEKDDQVKSYQTNVELVNWQEKCSIVGLRTSYVNTQWSSDFLIIKADDSVMVRELMSLEDLKKKSEIEKLEISRRYWKVAHVSDWGIILVESEGVSW